MLKTSHSSMDKCMCWLQVHRQLPDAPFLYNVFSFTISVYSSDWSCSSCNKYPNLEHSSGSAWQQRSLKDFRERACTRCLPACSAFLPLHYKGDSVVESRSACVAPHLPWGGSALDLTKIFTRLYLLSLWKTLPYLAHRTVRKSR